MDIGPKREVFFLWGRRSAVKTFAVAGVTVQPAEKAVSVGPTVFVRCHSTRLVYKYDILLCRPFVLCGWRMLQKSCPSFAPQLIFFGNQFVEPTGNGFSLHLIRLSTCKVWIHQQEVQMSSSTLRSPCVFCTLYWASAKLPRKLYICWIPSDLSAKPPQYSRSLYFLRYVIIDSIHNAYAILFLWRFLNAAAPTRGGYIT